MVKRQSEAAASSGAGDSPVLRGSGAQPVIPEQDEESPLTLALALTLTRTLTLTLTRPWP